MAALPIRFAEFTLDADNALLTCGERPIRLRPKTFDVLRCLVERRGTLVTKDEILATVWPGIVVGDANLQLCLSEVRKALGEDPKSPRFVETVHRRGYRFRADAVTASELAAAREAGGVPHGRSATGASSLVGRERELDVLTGLLRDARSGQRQVVFISGEAGIGKTSLVEAFLAGPATREPCRISRGQCITQFGPEVAYLPIFDALTTLAGAMPAHIVGVLRSAAPTWLMQMAALTTLAEREALSRSAGAVTSERLMREFAEAIETLASEQTVVLWLDDLHDSDTSTLELVGYLARRKTTARLVIIGTHRPTAPTADHALRRIALGLHERSLSTELQVSALTPLAVETYLRARLHASAGDGLASLARRVHARTDGNPLFVVRVTDDLIRQGVTHGDGESDAKLAAIPSTLDGMLSAQIDLLPEAERDALNVGSVIGRRFALQTVEAILGGTPLGMETVLERLAHTYRFIEPDGTEEWPEGSRAVMYRFRHALHQDVTYRLVSTLRREDLHRRIGQHREQTHARDIQTVAVELSSHFERGRDEARAVHYCLVGFEQALQRSAFTEALRLVTRGLALLPRLPAGPERDGTELRLRMAAVVCYATSLGHASPEADEACQRALELARQAADSVDLFAVLSGLFGCYLVGARYDTAVEVGERMLRVAEREASSVLALAARVGLGVATWHQGKLDAARAHFEERRALHRPADHLTFLRFGHDPAVSSLCFAAPVLWYLGYPDTARRMAEEGVALARGLAHAYSLGVALLFGARPFQESGDLERVAALVDEHEVVCRDQGFTEADARRALSRGWLLARQGRVTEGIDSLERGLRICDSKGTGLERSYHLTVLADAHARAEAFDHALRVIGEALAQSDATAERYYVPEMHRLRARILWMALERKAAHEDAGGDIEAALRAAITIARTQGSRGLELRAAATQVRWYLWLAARDGQALHAGLVRAYEELAEVHAWFTEGFDTDDLREAKALLDARRG